MANRILLYGVGFASLIPFAFASLIIFVLVTGNTNFPSEIVIGLLVGCVLFWAPSLAYLVYRIAKSNTDQATRTTWIVCLVMWAPILAPIVWYRFCFQEINVSS